MVPAYISLYNTGELLDRAKMLKGILKECILCPNNCKTDRTISSAGKCHTSDKIFISSVGAHFGEEPPLSGRGGSGTIFFTGCNMACIFCQNYDISQERFGKEITVNDLAGYMLSLQNSGTHNINFVTPTHYSPMIVEALALAVQKGFCLPLVYNCGGYESIEILRILDGIIDIYMPDIKYSDNPTALKFSGINNYWDVVKKSVKEMQRQVGDLKIDEFGIAERGLIIRHLVLPEDISGSEAVFKFISQEISLNAYLNIMDQYHPEYKAPEFPEINRRTSPREYNIAIRMAEKYNLKRLSK